MMTTSTLAAQYDIRKALHAWQTATDAQRPAARAAALDLAVRFPDVALFVVADEWQRADVAGFILDTVTDAASRVLFA